MSRYSAAGMLCVSVAPVAASPDKARRVLSAQVSEAGSNYVVSRLGFGDLTRVESMRSVELYAGAVMPALAAVREAAE